MKLMHTRRQMMTHSISQISAVSRLFSSAVIRELARHGKSPLFSRLAKEVPKQLSTESTFRVHNFFDAAFDLLKKIDCRHEYIYKAALTHKILLGKHSLQTASMLSEFRVGACKADIAILNGTATVYEIKSERDSLSRLEKQIDAYKKFFASVYVIAGENHLDEIYATVSEDVGILKLSNRYQISTLRLAKDLPDRTSSATIFESIQMLEAKQILKMMDISIPDVPNTEMHSALREKFIKLSSYRAHGCMVHVLKKSRNLLPLCNLVEKLPNSLQSAALSIPLRRLDHHRLVEAMNIPLEIALDWN